MKSKKIGNKALAEKSGIPLGTLNKIIYGDVENPSLETVRAIAKSLDCTLDDLAEGYSDKVDSELEKSIQLLRCRPELVKLVVAAANNSREEITSITNLLSTFKRK